jgi:hypothetical protein
MSKVLITSKRIRAFAIDPGCLTVPVVTMISCVRSMKIVEALLSSVFLNFRKSTAFWKAPNLSSFALLYNSNIRKKMSMEHWWNDSERVKLQNSVKILSLYKFVHKSHRNWNRTQASAVRGRRLHALEV